MYVYSRKNGRRGGGEDDACGFSLFYQEKKHNQGDDVCQIFGFLKKKKNTFTT